MEQRRHSQPSGQRKRKRGRGAAADAAAPSKRTLDKMSAAMRSNRRQAERGRRGVGPRHLRLPGDPDNVLKPRRPHAPSMVYRNTLARQQAGQRVASYRASRSASRSPLGTTSPPAGCPSQSRTGSRLPVMWRRTGLRSIIATSANPGRRSQSGGGSQGTQETGVSRVGKPVPGPQRPPEAAGPGTFKEQVRRLADVPSPGSRAGTVSIPNQTSPSSSQGPTGYSRQQRGDWGELLRDTVIAPAVLERRLHHSHVLNIRGDSYRLKDKRQAGLFPSQQHLPSRPETAPAVPIADGITEH